MNLINNKIVYGLGIFLVAISVVAGCQKMDRPEIGELILDPPPPPYSTLKSYWEFEDNVGDSGQFRAAATAKDITYVAGIKGKAAQIGAAGYVLISNLPDSLKTPGSFTLAFWMNGPGPGTAGAQGLFSISNSKEFWGNVDLFLENWGGPEAFLKVHMFNSNAADGKGEEWNELKIPNVFNKWTHIAVTYNAADSKFSIYSDGQPTEIHEKVLGGGNYGDLVFKDVNGMVLGNYQFQTTPSLTNHGPEDWAKPFNGALDQLRIYNVALSPSEVTALFDSKE